MNVDQDTDKRTVSEEGQAPVTRAKSAAAVFRICEAMKEGDAGRSRKRSRLLGQYKRFPPTSYSKKVQEGMDWETNVNWGSMKYLVDNRKSSYVDMLTERAMAAQIVTSHGEDWERAGWGHIISERWSEVLRKWSGYMMNAEKDIRDMLLFSKGIEMHDDEEGWQTKHIPAHNFIMPDDTLLDLSNYTEHLVLYRMSVIDLYKKISDRESAKARGWNVDFVIDLIRTHCPSESHRTNEAYMTAVASGDVMLSSSSKDDHVDVYIYYMKEFSGKVSKFILPQDYKRYCKKEGETEPQNDEWKKRIDRAGFLFAKTPFADKIEDILYLIINDGSAELWNELQGLGEDAFVQCREDDITKNRINDAVKINSMLMLQGTDALSDQKLRETEFNSVSIMPPELQFIQQRIQLPVQESMLTLQYLMQELYQNLGEYRVQERAKGGEAMTATQSQLDAAQSASLKSTDIKRYILQETIWQMGMFRRFVNTKRGECGYELFEWFEDKMRESGVPKEAYKWENIENFNGVLLVGAGSPQFKLVSAEKAIEFTNIEPKDEGQAAAIEDGLAAVVGRSNVARYIRKKPKTPDDEDLRIGYENELFGNPLVNPQNIPVLSKDNHIKHVMMHMNEVARLVMLAQNAIDKNTPLPEVSLTIMMAKVMNAGAHIEAHLKMLETDKSKQTYVNALRDQFNMIQTKVDQVVKGYLSVFPPEENEQQPVLSEEQIRSTLAAIEINRAEKIAQIEIGSKAALANLRQEEARKKGTQGLAIELAKANIANGQNTTESSKGAGKDDNKSPGLADSKAGDKRAYPKGNQGESNDNGD